MWDKEVDNILSADACYLLIKLMKLAPNENNSNDALKKKTGFSKRKFDKAKKELVSKGFLDTKQLYGNVYALYIGKDSVIAYKKRFKKGDNRHEQHKMSKLKNSLDSIKTAPSKSRESQIVTL